MCWCPSPYVIVNQVLLASDRSSRLEDDRGAGAFWLALVNFVERAHAGDRLADYHGGVLCPLELFANFAGARDLEEVGPGFLFVTANDDFIFFQAFRRVVLVRSLGLV